MTDVGRKNDALRKLKKMGFVSTESDLVVGIPKRCVCVFDRSALPIENSNARGYQVSYKDVGVILFMKP